MCHAATVSRTSFSNLGKGQAGTPLQIDIVRVYKSAEGSKGFAGEEVDFSSLYLRTISAGRTDQATQLHAYVFEILEQLRNSLTLTLSKCGIVQSIFGLFYARVSMCCSAESSFLPPQQEHAFPMVL